MGYEYNGVRHKFTCDWCGKTEEIFTSDKKEAEKELKKRGGWNYYFIALHCSRKCENLNVHGVHDE